MIYLINHWMLSWKVPERSYDPRLLLWSRETEAEILSHSRAYSRDKDPGLLTPKWSLMLRQGGIQGTESSFLTRIRDWVHLFQLLPLPFCVGRHSQVSFSWHCNQRSIHFLINNILSINCYFSVARIQYLASCDLLQFWVFPCSPHAAEKTK